MRFMDKPPFTIRQLSAVDLEDILNLQALIVSCLPKPEMLAPYDATWLAQHLETQGLIRGGFAARQLVAYHHLYYPAAHDRERNLGRDIGLETHELGRVANIQMVAVHPDHRGQGLARHLNQLAVQAVIDEGRCRHLCATVSPLNYDNLKLMLGAGLQIKALKPKYGGKMRYIFHRSLVPQPPCHRGHSPQIVVDPQDWGRQQDLIAQGYRGLAVSSIDSGNSGWMMVFGR